MLKRIFLWYNECESAALLPTQVLLKEGFKMKTILKRITLFSTVLALAFAVPVAQSLAAKDATPVASSKTGEGAQAFIEGMAQRALDFLSNDKLSHDQKKGEFKKLLQNSFDMDTIGRFSLGRYWREATPAQQKEYLRLFNNMVVKVYSNRFKDYKGQKFDVRSNRPEGDLDTVVTSFIIPQSGEPVQVDWRVRYKNKSYQIVDVIVEGVSMSVTQRSDFSSVIQRGGGDVQVLIDYLKKDGVTEAMNKK